MNFGTCKIHFQLCKIELNFRKIDLEKVYRNVSASARHMFEYQFKKLTQLNLEKTKFDLEYATLNMVSKL